MEKLVKKDVKDDGKTYFMFTNEDANFIKRVRSEFGLSNTELAQYCLNLLRAVIKNPEIIDYIVGLNKK